MIVQPVGLCTDVTCLDVVSGTPAPDSGRIIRRRGWSRLLWQLVIAMM